METFMQLIQAHIINITSRMEQIKLITGDAKVKQKNITTVLNDN